MVSLTVDVTRVRLPRVDQESSGINSIVRLLLLERWSRVAEQVDHDDDDDDDDDDDGDLHARLPILPADVKMTDEFVVQQQ
ncbi:hypothetical protein OUZ56_024928 [Daphnia magna]|uniref:Uncharacterized protein n=1 Tax=Daphnia magna TaxID=35525 RepID=A0ABQ9ZIF1_9CRUS|nr:hypothetical protein OUZ56_024928 [Daphnia magna]